MIKKILLMVILFSTMLFADLPYNKVFRGVPTDIASYLFDQNTSIGRSQRLPLTTVAEDTIATSLIFTKRSRIEAIEIFVTDTVESQGDTCYFKLFIGADKILDQKTSAFKLPAFYTFSPLVNWTSSDNSYLYKALANTKSGATSGITEGNFLVKIKYYIP